MKFELILKTTFEIDPTSDEVEDIQAQTKIKAESIRRDIAQNLGLYCQIFGIASEDNSINFFNENNNKNE